MEYVIKPEKVLSLNWKELWSYRELFVSYIWRDVKVRYKQTLLGFSWAILQPLMMMAIFVVFFSRMLNVPTDGIPAPIFYYSGLNIWVLFSTGLSNASNSMVSNAEVIKKIYFPRIIIPMSSVVVAFFDYLMTLVVFAALIIGYSVLRDDFVFSVWKLFAYTPLAVLIAVCTAFGFGSLVASLNIKYRDFRFVIPFFIQLLMFLTPVIYPVSVLKDIEWLKYILSLNPIMLSINLSRGVFTNAPIDPVLMSISIGAMVIMFFLGIYVFRKTERFFADIA